MSREKVILDVDTGSDDAVAIVCALLCKEIELLGITTVGGNVELKNTTENTLRVLDLCGEPILWKFIWVANCLWLQH